NIALHLELNGLARPAALQWIIAEIDDPSDGLVDRPLKCLPFHDRLEVRRPQDLDRRVVKDDDELRISRHQHAAASMSQYGSPRVFRARATRKQSDSRFVGLPDEAIVSPQRGLFDLVLRKR